MPDYLNSRIYKLVNDVDDKIYVGSTTTSLAKRKAQHRTTAKRKPNRHVYAHLNTIGWEHVSIVLIENVQCLCREDLHRHERRWIDELKPELNKAVPLRTHAEYYQDNKEQFLERQQQYYQANREQVLEQHKQYYQVNAEHIKGRQKQYYQANAEQIREYNKQYRQANAEQIRECKKQYYQANKANINRKVVCTCGSTIAHGGLKRHQRTKKHIAFTTQQTQATQAEFARLAMLAE